MKLTRPAALAALLCLAAPFAVSAAPDAGPAIDAPVAAEGSTEAPAAAPDKPAESGDAEKPAEETAPQADADPLKLGAEIYSRIRSGEWLPALAAVLMLLVWAVRRFGGKLIPALKTKAGGYFVGIGAAFAVSLSTWAASGQPFSIGVLSAALGAAWAAAGSYDAIRDAIKGKKGAA